MNSLKVAVLNSSKEITDILQEALEMEGIPTCSTFTYILKEDEKKFDLFVKKFKPSVIVYDIALPYEENYELLKRIYKRPSAKGIAFILTTTNKTALEKLVGTTTAYEIIGKPYDLFEVIKAVKNGHTYPK